jgi:ribosomal protein S27AE
MSEIGGNEIRSAQYTAHCGKCGSVRPLTRLQVMSGRNPMCEHCGTAMVVYLQGGLLPAPQQQAKTA